MRPRAIRLLRCAVLAALASGAGLELWRWHPGSVLRSGPDADIITGCACLTWAVASYLCLAVLSTAASCALHVRVLARLAPPLIRRLVEVTVTAGLIGAVSGAGLASAATATGHPTTSGHPTRPPLAGSLDWPGLPPVADHVAHPRPDGAATVVVQPGDSLWTIAARHLGPQASPAQVATAWPQWWQANRTVIGPDPNLIHPGLRLTPPTTRPGSPQ